MSLGHKADDTEIHSWDSCCEMTFLVSVLEPFNWAASLIPLGGVSQEATLCSAALAPGPCLTLCFSPSLSLRSSDSEEAFETPESTTPVKAPPAPPPPPPEFIPEPEVSAPPPPEEPGNQGSGAPWGDTAPLPGVQLEEGTRLEAVAEAL